MNPVIFNCVLLYILVVGLSVVQSRFKIVKDSPLTFVLLLIFTPILVIGKAKGRMSWAELTGMEIWAWTLMIALFNARHMLPRINEGFIYAYTLFHWYLLIEAIDVKGFNLLLGTITGISVYPTFLIIKSAFEHKRLEATDKIILFYWFLFTISFTYIDQVALNVIRPILAMVEISGRSILYVVFTAVQLYFIAASFTLLMAGIPVFHMERSGDSFSVRWKKAMASWRKLLRHKLDNYIEYQISTLQVVYITAGSLVLFYLDANYQFRPYMIAIYTVVLPLIFFYFQSVPEENIETESEVTAPGADK